MPAEWEPHASTWLAWPHYRGDWPGKFEPIPWVYAEIIRHLGRHERIDLIVNSAASEKHARKVLSKANALSKNVRFHRWPTNRVWTRDSGCTFVVTDAHVGTAVPEPSGRAQLDSHRHQMALQRLGQIPQLSARRKDRQPHGQSCPRRRKSAPSTENRASSSKAAPSTSTDAAPCSPPKNACSARRSNAIQRWPAQDYEKLFSDYLGIKNVIWLDSGIAGDDTHGHVDDITRFVSPDTVVTAIESDPDDPNYEPLRENIRRLRAATDQDGKPLAIVELPMPGPVVFEKRRLPASYANFYIANGIVLVPVFNDPNDRVALDILADLFPDREIVGIYSGDLIWGFGAMHCMTQQQPEASRQSLAVGSLALELICVRFRRMETPRKVQA